MGKVNNALNMLMLLKSRNKMTRREIAEELEVDVRQISRYKDDLCMAGISIKEERGRYGGYSLKCKTPWIDADLTEDEVKALEAATNYIQDGFPLKSDFNSGIAKVLSNYKLRNKDNINKVKLKSNSKKKIKVKLKIYYPYAKRIKEYKWVNKDKIEDHQKENYMIYDVDIENKDDVIEWVMRMGSNVEVIEPKDIKEEIISECKKIMRLYKK